MDELIAFLNARLDDDYQVARLATPGPWRFGDWSATFGTVEQTRTVIEHSPDHGRFPAMRRGEVEADLVLQLEDLEYDEAQQLNAAHILRQHPARVLADIAAKRAIVLDHRPYIEDDGPKCDTCFDRYATDRPRSVPFPCFTLRLLALPYADHPDFKAEWHPTLTH